MAKREKVAVSTSPSTCGIIDGKQKLKIRSAIEFNDVKIMFNSRLTSKTAIIESVNRM